MNNTIENKFTLKEKLGLGVFAAVSIASVGCGIAIGYHQAKGMPLDSGLADLALEKAPVVITGALGAFIGRNISMIDTKDISLSVKAASVLAVGAAGAGTGYALRKIGEGLGYIIGYIC